MFRTVGATLLTAAFGFIVWGASGPFFDDSITGLARRRTMDRTVGAFGFLAVATSYVSTALNLRSFFDMMFLCRERWPDRHDRCTGGVVLIGAENFVAISFTGAVFGSMTAVIISLLYIAVAACFENPLGVPTAVAYGTAVVAARPWSIGSGHCMAVLTFKFGGVGY